MQILPMNGPNCCLEHSVQLEQGKSILFNDLAGPFVYRGVPLRRSGDTHYSSIKPVATATSATSATSATIDTFDINDTSVINATNVPTTQTTSNLAPPE